MKRDFVTVSNLLSIFRASLVVPFVLVMLLPETPLRGWGTVIVLCGMVTDNLDGRIARKLGQETEWGRILDPLADKVALAAVALVLLRLGDVPFWFVGALILRDLLIFGGGVFLRVTRGVVLPSNLYGKWTVGVIAVTMLCAMLGILREQLWLMLTVCSAGLVLSFAAYCARFVHTVTAPRS